MLTTALKSVFQQRSHASSSLMSGGLFSFGSGASSTISTDNSLKLSALYNGVTIISNDIALLPKAIFHKEGDQKIKLTDHPITTAISKFASANMSSFWFHKVVVIAAILRGNGVAIINRNKQTGEIDTTNPFTFVHPNHLIDIRMVDGQLWFFTKYGTYHNSEVIHIKGFSLNGYAGDSVLKYAATNLNAALTAEAFADKNFESKGFGLGIIKTDKQLKDTAKKALTEGMAERLSKGNQYNVGVLDEGMDFQPIQVSAKEAELIDWKKISIEDIARWLNIGPHKLKHLDKLNYSSIEQQSIDHVSDSIYPWVKQFENEYDIKLINTKDQSTDYTKFNINALLRADIKSRAQYYNQMRFAGILSGDEIRELEDMNPTGLEHMKDPLQPVQIQQQSQIKEGHGD